MHRSISAYPTPWTADREVMLQEPVITWDLPSARLVTRVTRDQAHTQADTGLEDTLISRRPLPR